MSCGFLTSSRWISTSSIGGGRHSTGGSRSRGGTAGEDWAENFEHLPGGAGVSLILESTTAAGVGPRLHLHPYAETFVIRRGGAEFTVSDVVSTVTAGHVLVVPAETPHKFTTLAGGYEAVHIHASESFAATWLE